MPPQPLDLVGVIVALLTYAVSKDAANVLGPYAAIVILACAGSALSLSGSDSEASSFNLRAVWYVCIRIFLAVSLTVVIAELVQLVFPALQPRYSLSPIAFAIGWIRDYNQVRAFFGRLAERFANKKVDS